MNFANVILNSGKICLSAGVDALSVITKLLIRPSFSFIIFISLLLAGCGDSNDPAKVVEHYLAAKVAQDEDTVRNLLCSEMEERYEMELLSFESASEATIVGMLCTWQAGEEVVDCEGKIVASYGGEVNEFPLGSYRVVEEDGEFKWCGEAP